MPVSAPVVSNHNRTMDQHHHKQDGDTSLHGHSPSLGKLNIDHRKPSSLAAIIANYRAAASASHRGQERLSDLPFMKTSSIFQKSPISAANAATSEDPDASRPPKRRRFQRRNSQTAAMLQNSLSGFLTSDYAKEEQNKDDKGQATQVTPGTHQEGSACLPPSPINNDDSAPSTPNDENERRGHHQETYDVIGAAEELVRQFGIVRRQDNRNNKTNQPSQEA